MANSPSFVQHVLDLIAPLAPVTARAMFGGHRDNRVVEQLHAARDLGRHRAAQHRAGGQRRGFVFHAPIADFHQAVDRRAAAAIEVVLALEQRRGHLHHTRGGRAGREMRGVHRVGNRRDDHVAADRAQRRDDRRVVRAERRVIRNRRRLGRGRGLEHFGVTERDHRQRRRA